MKQASGKAPARLYFLVSQCVLIPAVVAESMFEREGQKTAIEEGCLHNERGFPGSTQL